MTQGCKGVDSGTRVIVFVQGKKESKLHTPCEEKTRGLPKGARKQGGNVCAQCGVQKPTPVSKWLRRMNWADGAVFLLEQARSLSHTMEFCVDRGWLRDATVADAKNWFLDELGLSVQALLNAESLTRPVVVSLVAKLKGAARRKDFFGPAFRGVIQHEVLDCARQLSVELWCEGGRPDLVLRPGGQYYAYLHSLSSFLYETKRKVTIEGLCESIDTAYPEFDAQEKRLVFAFLLVREYARRLNNHGGKSAGIKENRQRLILDFLRRAAAD